MPVAVRRLLLLVVCIVVQISCGPRDDRLRRGREVVQAMGERIASLDRFSVTTAEVRDARRPNKPQLTITRVTTVRRPDRMHFRTTGSEETEGWYDGRRLTLAMHGERVFAQARMPETLDRAHDSATERYGVSLVGADLLYSRPDRALLSGSATGGYVGVEQVDGRACDHVAFKDSGVEWELWIEQGDNPLPRRMRVRYTGGKPRQADVRFVEWVAKPDAPDQLFRPSLPADYEGIAMIQRAAILPHVEAPAATSGEKPATGVKP
jgi:hypothetical protein